MSWFLTKEERSQPSPLLKERAAHIAVLVKTAAKTFLRVVDQGYTPVVPLGTLVVPLPEHFLVEDEVGLLLLPKWQWFLCLGSGQQFQALVDLRPDWNSGT
jgi:hypothetical protein